MNKQDLTLNNLQALLYNKTNQATNKATKQPARKLEVFLKKLSVPLRDTNSVYAHRK